MNLYMAQQEIEYYLKKAKFNGKYEFVKKMNSLIQKSMSIEEAIAYLGEEMKEEWNELSRLEKYYER